MSDPPPAPSFSPHTTNSPPHSVVRKPLGDATNKPKSRVDSGIVPGTKKKVAPKPAPKPVPTQKTKFSGVRKTAAVSQGVRLKAMPVAPVAPRKTGGHNQSPSSSTAASGPSLIARSTPSRCHSSATCVGVAPSASSAFGSAPARSSARATEVRPSCAAYLRAVVVVVMIEEVAVAVAAAVVAVVVWEEEVASWWERRGSKGEGGK